jgi:hypothetical protein
MARGVVHEALCAAVVTIGWLTGAFITFRLAMAPSHRCRCGRGRSGQWLVAASLLLVVAVAVVAALGLCPDVGLALPLCRLGDWGVPGMTLHSLGTLVCHVEERRNILDVVGGELLQHLLIPYSLVKCNHHRSIGDTGNGIANLREPLDEGVQGFPRALLDDVEVGLVARSSISTLEIGHEQVAQLWPGVKGPLREIRVPRPDCTCQGYAEVVDHDDLIPLCSEDGGGVDLQELGKVNHPVILLW